MKKILVSVLLVVCMAVACVLTSCSGGNEKKTTVHLKVIAGDYVLCDEDVAVKGADEEGKVAVIDVIKTVIDKNSDDMVIELDETGKSLKKYDVYYTSDIGGVSYFWDYTIDGKAPEGGKADSNFAHEGASIVYTFMAVTTDGDNKAVTKPYDSADNVFEAEEDAE